MKVFLLLLIILSFTSCEYIDEMTTSSSTVSEKMEVGEVENIIVNCACHLTLTNNNEGILVVEGQEHLLQDLNISSENNSVTIDHFNRKYLPKTKLINIEANFNQLQKITLNHVVQVITNDTIHSNNLLLVVNGRGRFSECDLLLKNAKTTLNIYGASNICNLNLAGKTEVLKITLEGAANIYANELNCNQASVAHRSIGECYVYCNKTLNVTTSSTGNTYYTGNPSSITHSYVQIPNLTPSGQLIKVGD